MDKSFKPWPTLSPAAQFQSRFLLPRVEMGGQNKSNPTAWHVTHTLWNFDIWGRGCQSNLFLEVWICCPSTVCSFKKSDCLPKKLTLQSVHLLALPSPPLRCLKSRLGFTWRKSGCQAADWWMPSFPHSSTRCNPSLDSPLGALITNSHHGLWCWNKTPFIGQKETQTALEKLYLIYSYIV